MEQYNILLSIAIPTYNRADYLKRCLDHIVVQFGDEQVRNSVEVVISDNASPDNTQEVAKEYQARFPNIKYFRNEKNVGFDLNVINAVEKSTGKYCWHIGDDDFIQNGALKFVLDFLAKREPALLTFIFHPFFDDTKSLTMVSDISEKNIKYGTSAEDFWRKEYCQGTLALFAFRRDLWLKAKTAVAEYELFWAYYEIILKMMLGPNLTLAYLDYPVIYMGQDFRWNSGPNTHAPKIQRGVALFTLIRWRKVLQRLKQYGYSEEFINYKIRTTVRDGLINNLLSAKTFGLDVSLENLRILLQEFYMHPFHLAIALPLFFIPNSWLRLAKNLKNLRRIKKGSGA